MSKLYARLKFRKQVDEKFYDLIEAVAEIHSISGQAPSFSVTGSTWKNGIDESGGCIHDLIEKHFPFLKKYIKWHLTSTEGPMHYLANTLYHAGDKDYNGLRKGESRQSVCGTNGKPMWRAEITPSWVADYLKTWSGSNLICRDEPFDSIPCEIVYKPVLIIGEGKERQLDYARSTAVWPEATDEELMADDLKDKLIARLPGLMQQWRANMRELFTANWKVFAPEGVTIREHSVDAAVDERDIF